MKNNPFNPLWPSVVVIVAIAFSSCGDEEKPKSVPDVITVSVDNVTTTSATAVCEITADGNAEITASGLVYSSTNTNPTTGDSKTQETARKGTFTSEMTGLASGTTYHVRAYATNSVGTGYGSAVSFTTGNAAPVVANIAIAGTIMVNSTVTVSYTYSDAEGDAESGTTFQWYRASDGSGSGEEQISGATGSSYILQEIDELKFIRAGVTPKASAGTSPGSEAKSGFSGPIEDAVDVTFTYNNKTVTYGIIKSPVTGRKWLDRNLGAPATPTAYNDWANYGDLFQWGRGADGHQLIKRGPTLLETSAVITSTASTLANTDTPGPVFIVTSSGPLDWRSPQNDALWQGVNGINNPCPAGWRIPTLSEWQEEKIIDLDPGYAQLKLTSTGGRSVDGRFQNLFGGYYWASSYSGQNSHFYAFFGGTFSVGSGLRVWAFACRCIKDK